MCPWSISPARCWAVPDWGTRLPAASVPPTPGSPETPSSQQQQHTAMLPHTLILATLASMLSSTSAFSCPGVTENGFKPVCCMGKDGQVALNCIPAHQMGSENPTWECNAGPPYRSQGCCQSIGYTNTGTGMSIYLCSDYIGP